MSGQFSGCRNIEELKAFFPIDKAVCELAPNLNIAPAREVLAIIRYTGHPQASSLPTMARSGKRECG